MISDVDEADIVRVLTLDVTATISAGAAVIVASHAKEARQFASSTDDYRQRVVDAVQQEIHNTFVDTVWPACPHHDRHPLWFSEGWWHCVTASGRSRRSVDYRGHERDSDSRRDAGRRRRRQTRQRGRLRPAGRSAARRSTPRQRRRAALARGDPRRPCRRARPLQPGTDWTRRPVRCTGLGSRRWRCCRSSSARVSGGA